jgi:hypothetical protein
MLSSLIGLSGVVIGIILGHFLNRSDQHADWLRDKRRQEYREVLSAIAGAYVALLHLTDVKEQGGLSPEHKLSAERAVNESFRTLRDRIVIAGEITFADSLNEWATAIQSYRTGDLLGFADRFTSISKMLVEMALVPTEKPSLMEQISRWNSHRKAMKEIKRNRSLN